MLITYITPVEVIGHTEYGLPFKWLIIRDLSLENRTNVTSNMDFNLAFLSINVLAVYAFVYVVLLALGAQGKEKGK